MTPPARTGFSLADTDQPCRTQPRYGVAWPVIWACATLLGLISTAFAWQLTRSFGEAATSPGALLFVNLSWWYAWALVTPAIIWLSQHFRFERQGLWRAVLVHAPSVVLFSFAHIVAMSTIRWWAATAAGDPFSWTASVRTSVVDTFDWQMLTYWAIVGVGHAVLYYREARDRAQRAALLESQLVVAQLTALQKQLHPHFLFNALNAISTLMYRDVAAADRTLIRLSDLLRLSLEHAGLQEISLQSELDFLSRYLEIEQVRFADRLSVDFDVQPDTLQARVPNLILQPLVENAIKHGVAKKGGPGRIAISARHEGGKLWMEVRDDGVGLSEEAWMALHKGIGVSTTHARLRHLFGADFRFEFHRQSPGLTVVLALPFRTGPVAVLEGTHGRNAATTDRPLRRTDGITPAGQHL